MNQDTPILFTILLPVQRNAELLPFAIESVLSQTIKPFELFIVCDGTPADTIDCAYEFSKKDPRVRVFTFPKGVRHGEAHRHTALMQASGQFIAHIADDDLWFPNHLEEMEKLLRKVDFGNLYQTGVDAEGDLYGPLGDLNDNETITRMLRTKFNFFGLSVCGYKLSAYKSLPEGWSAAPEDIWTDLYMWRKFLSAKELKLGSRLAITSLHFPTPLRKSFSEEDRKNEIQNWSLRIKSHTERDNISQQMLKKITQYRLDHAPPVSSNIKNTQPTYKISAIIPVYNGKKYLRDALNSVISQTLSPHEIIVVDDGSTDNSIESINDIKTNIPIHFVKQKNSGQSAARNHGARLATGDCLAFLDQDDVWYPDHLKKLVQPFLKIPNLAWSYSNLDEIDENNHLIQIGLLDITPTEHPKKSVMNMMSQDMFILPSASLILKQAFDEVDGFDVRLSGYEDDDLFMRLFEAGWKNFYIPKSLSQWRIYSDSSSHSERMDISRMIYAKKLIEKFPDKPKVNKFWSKDLILPRFLNMTLSLYIFHCLKLKDFDRSKKLSKHFQACIALLPKKRLKWKFIGLFLNSPRLCYFLIALITTLLPKKIIQFMVHLILG